MTEPESGSDALHMRTRAERRGDYYLLNGSKQYITNAPVADVLLVYASVQDRPGSRVCPPSSSTPGHQGSR